MIQPPSRGHSFAYANFLVLPFFFLQRRQESYGGSSSDENRSSGHASMSDGHTSSSPPAETLPRHTHYRTCLNAVPEDDKSVPLRVSSLLARSCFCPEPDAGPLGRHRNASISVGLPPSPFSRLFELFDSDMIETVIFRKKLVPKAQNHDIQGKRR